MTRTLLLTGFTIFFQITALHAQESRTFDGTGNNVSHPEWGAAGTQLIRVTSNGFADSISLPGGQNRPNPRLVSNTLFDQQNPIADELKMSDYTWVFGQFIDHDLDLVEDNFSEPAFIPVPAGDAYFDPGGSGSVFIPMFRSHYDAATGTSPSAPRQHINEITSWLDASMVYGSDDERADWLRTFADGKLKVSDGNLLPFNTLSGAFGDDTDTDAPFMADSQPVNEKLFVAGDVRANEQPLLVALHTLFVREHNRLCGELKLQHRDWTDEELFQHARRINTGLIQAIVYEEWLPSMGIAIPPYLGYDPAVHPGIMNVFSAAAFRLGHTLVNSNIVRMDEHGKPMAEGDLSMRDGFFKPMSVKNGGGISPLLQGMATQPQQHLDCQVVDDLRNFLFGAPGQGGLDLAAININRGRERGLPDYNTLRKDFGLVPVEYFTDITADMNTAARLEALYGDVNNIDPWVGMLAEDHTSNTIAGETIQTILKRQFQALRDGDRFYYENDTALSASEIASIKDTRLSDVIRRNTKITIIQDNVFYAMPHGEALASAMQPQLRRSEIVVYPNPVAGEELHAVAVSHRTKDSAVYVVDMLGRQVSQKAVRLEYGLNHFSLPLDPQLPAGVYQVVMYDTNSVEIAKFVKQ